MKTSSGVRQNYPRRRRMFRSKIVLVVVENVLDNLFMVHYPIVVIVFEIRDLISTSLVNDRQM